MGCAVLGDVGFRKGRWLTCHVEETRRIVRFLRSPGLPFSLLVYSHCTTLIEGRCGLRVLARILGHIGMQRESMCGRGKMRRTENMHKTYRSPHPSPARSGISDSHPHTALAVCSIIDPPRIRHTVRF